MMSCCCCIFLSLCWDIEVNSFIYSNLELKFVGFLLFEDVWRWSFFGSYQSGCQTCVLKPSWHCRSFSFFWLQLSNLRKNELNEISRISVAKLFADFFSFPKHNESKYYVTKSMYWFIYGCVRERESVLNFNQFKLSKLRLLLD